MKGTINTMKSGELRYTVYSNEYITNWLTGGVIETPFVAKMTPTIFENYHPGASVKRADGKERTSPAKDEFLERAIFKESGFPAGVPIEALYWPFDTQLVDFSGFWHLPCDITFYARAYIYCEQACVQPIEISTCGAIKIWVNGRENAAFYPYESNIEARKSAQLALEAGRNEIVVGCNNYGERNIVFNFGIKNMGGPLAVSLPVNADIPRIKAINASLAAMYLDRLSYIAGKITLHTDQAFACDCGLRVCVGGITKKLEVREGDGKLVWGDAGELPIGYHEFVISCDIDGIMLSKKLWAEVYPRELETETPATYAERQRLALTFIVRNTAPTFEQFIAHLELGENRYEQYRDVIETLVTHVRQRGDCADFRVTKILWVLKKFRPLLTKEQAGFFEETLLNFRYWFDEKGNDAMWFFSENHALCFHTGQLLAGELFPGSVFSNSGLTGQQQSAKAKRLIVEWIEKLLTYGYNEWNSAAYIPVDILSYISLRELSLDQEIRELAQKALDYTYEIFANNSFHGLLGTSNGRTYPRDLLANKNLTTNPLMWLAWGEGCLNSHVDPLIFMALSEYQPPERLADIAKWDSKQKLIVTEFQGTLRVPTTLCKTIDYILGSCKSPRIGGPGSQEHLLNLFIKDHQSRIWINHPGEGKIFGEKRPGYFTGNGLTPLVLQQGNVAVVHYNFSEELLQSAEVKFTHAFCDLHVCDEVELQEHWAFVRRGDTFAALYAKNGLTVSQRAPLQNKELISPGINSTWLVKVAAVPEIDSFRHFVDWMAANTPTEQDGKLFFRDFAYGNMEFKLW